MNTTTESKPIDKLVGNIIETRYENFDDATITHAKNRVIDVLGCMIAGAKDDGNLALRELILDWGGKKEATILIHGEKVPAGNAAMLNAVMARSTDFDPVDPFVDGAIIPGHISGTTVTTALTMGEVNKITGKEFLTSMLVGDDFASRVIGASGFDFKQGWDGTGTVNSFGATAIAGRILGLDNYQMKNALGIALNQMAGSFQNFWDEKTAFKLPIGLGARNGIFSAQLSQKGWAGPEDPLQSQFGYYNLYTPGCAKPEILTKDLGKKYYSDITFKPYPGCRLTHPAIDCALTIVQKYNINPEDIKEAIFYVFNGSLNNYCAQPFKVKDYPMANAVLNFQYVLSTALLRRGVKPEHFTEEAIRDNQVTDLICKIRLDELNGGGLQSARLKLIMNDGSEFSEFTDTPKGHAIANPMSRDEIVAKYWLNIEFSKAVSNKNAEELLRIIDQLEALDNINEMVVLLI